MMAVADYVLAFCVLIGLAGVAFGYRTPAALLAILAVAWYAPRLGYNLSYWELIALGMGALTVIIQPVMTLPDRLIAGLFPVQWLSYLLPSPHHYWGAFAVVCVQLLLCAPFLWTQRGRWSVSHGPLREISYEAR